jgi:hypothetical protein
MSVDNRTLVSTHYLAPGLQSIYHRGHCYNVYNTLVHLLKVSHSVIPIQEILQVGIAHFKYDILGL